MRRVPQVLYRISIYSLGRLGGFSVTSKSDQTISIIWKEFKQLWSLTASSIGSRGRERRKRDSPERPLDLHNHQTISSIYL